MILGKIIGKITTNEFRFLVDEETSKFEYVQVYHKLYDYVLCQIIEIEKDSAKTIAYCQVLGYKDKNKIKKPRVPFDPDSEVLLAEDEFIKQVIKLEEGKKGALIGKLDGHDINVHLDLNKVLTMHLAVLAKSGSGKSYAVGVLLEEMFSKNIPVLVIDPHGEYSSLKQKNSHKEEILKLKEYGLEPEPVVVQEYGDLKINQDVKPLQLSSQLSSEEIMHLMPGKLSSNQMAVLYSSLKNLPTPSFDSLLLSLEQEENNAKYSLMTNIERLRDTGLFSEVETPYNELVKPGCCTILNMKGMNPDIQEIIVYKISKDLFELRKQNKLPPFFLVIEEAHNFCPERNFGEAKSSKVLRNIASEGRKFGLGLCIISQRPARVDKSVLSQCTTQVILKITNPNDLKAVSASIEGITLSTEKEIQNLAIGTAIVTGLTEMPLLVDIRPRKTEHGGKAQDVLKENEFMEKMQEFEEEDLLALIKPKTTPKDLVLMAEKEVAEISTSLIPCQLLTCEESSGKYFILVEMVKGSIVSDIENFKTKNIPNMNKLTKQQIDILKFGFKHKSFTEKDFSEDVNEDLKILAKQDYLLKDSGTFSLTDNYLFSKLSNHQIFDKPTFENVQYTTKLEAKVNLDELKKKISKFTDIKDTSECYLVRYEVKE